MKKIKMFFVVTTLLLFTAGVFAGKKKFTTGTIYGYTTAVGYCSLASSATLTGLTTTLACGAGSIQAKVNDCNGTLYSLYLYNGTTYTPLYFKC